MLACTWRWLATFGPDDRFCPTRRCRDLARGAAGKAGPGRQERVGAALDSQTSCRAVRAVSPPPPPYLAQELMRMDRHERNSARELVDVASRRGARGFGALHGSVAVFAAWQDRG